MKSERGVTLISITVYVIAMTIIVAIITVITNYFSKNVDYETEELQFSKQYTTINMFFAEEANLKNNKVLEIGEDTNQNNKKQKWIVFTSNNQYTYVEENKSLYRNNVKIGKNIEEFEVTRDEKNGVQGFKIKIRGYKDNSYYFQNQ